MNHFLKSIRVLSAVDDATAQGRPKTKTFERMTQFYTRESPYDIRSAELEFRIHNPEPSDTTRTLEALQPHRTQINRILSFFQQVRFVDHDTSFTLKSIQKVSEFTLEIDTNTFAALMQQKHTPYFFWTALAVQGLIALLLSPGSAKDSVRS